MAGITVGVVVWWPMALASAIGWFVLVVLSSRRLAAVNDYLAEAFPDAERPEKLTVSRELRGKIGDMPWVVRNRLESIEVWIGTGIDHEVVIERRQGYGIGDPGFDADLAVCGRDGTGELAWRMMLVPEIRAELREVFAGYSVTLSEGWFVVDIYEDDLDAEAIVQLIRNANAVGEAMTRRLADGGEDVVSWFIERVPSEPLAAVRRTHYEWLAGSPQAAAALRQAAKDPDPAIRQWASEQQPSDEAVYR